MEPYADVIIDLSVKNVDRIFQYRIPDHLKELVKPGVQVNIPFGKGNTERKGIVVGLSKETDYDPEKMKELLDEGPLFHHDESGTEDGSSRKGEGDAEGRTCDRFLKTEE